MHICCVGLRATFDLIRLCMLSWKLWILCLHCIVLVYLFWVECDQYYVRLCVKSVGPRSLGRVRRAGIGLGRTIRPCAHSVGYHDIPPSEICYGVKSRKLIVPESQGKAIEVKVKCPITHWYPTWRYFCLIGYFILPSLYPFTTCLCDELILHILLWHWLWLTLICVKFW